MDCIFCQEQGTVEIVSHSIWGTARLYRAECEFCGARGQSHITVEAAAQEWQDCAARASAPAVWPQCEHTPAAIVCSDEGTCYCAECERAAREREASYAAR